MTLTHFSGPVTGEDDEAPAASSTLQNILGMRETAAFVQNGLGD